MATNKKKHLEDVLESHRMSKEQQLVDKHVEKRKEISDELQSKYGSNLYTPFNSGSYAKHTAMNKKFDMDLIAPFTRKRSKRWKSCIQMSMTFYTISTTFRQR